jgi:hypothetical protein
VKLPADFTGSFHSKTVQEFQDLAQALLHETMGARYPTRNSEYAIVSICFDMGDLCTITPRNHRAYADLHGYDYLVAQTGIKGVHPKMLKYLVLSWAMQKGYKWTLMMDADAMFMNTGIALEPLLEEAFPTNNTTSLVATRGGNWRNIHAINNGIFLLKNSEWSMQHSFEIFTARRAYTKFLGKTLIDQPLQLSILVARGELDWPPNNEEEQGEHVMIVRKLLLNAFYRDEEYRGNDDREGGSWERGDFIVHFASRRKYDLMIELLTAEGLIASILPAPSITSTVITMVE